jgi:hypothetical protein
LKENPDEQLAVYEATELSGEAQTLVDMSATDYTAEAIAAIADLDDESRIDKMMRVGAAIVAAKDALPHGALTNWYKNVLRRSESWCSLYCRLYKDRDILQEALDWAARTNHKLARSYAIEQLLKIIADYKLKVLGASVPAPRTPWTPKRVVAKAQPDEIIAQLHKLLADAEEDFEALRLEVVTAPSSDVGDARDALLSLIQRVENRLRELDETCSSLQVSDP